ncbi:MAG: hypothetical protein K5643_01645 [Saccharofermentans sp.]|nr:hypothetical protein [Saccharofermentans sp.]
MTVLEGRLFTGNLVTEIYTVEMPEDDRPFSQRLETALVSLCEAHDIPVPMWMAKNTKEFAAFRQTIFFADQYIQKVRFDRFQIKLTDM